MELLNNSKSLNKLINDRVIIVLSGPTASGKTSAAIELSKMIDIEVISADSRQIFKFLDIGTAKPTQEEQDAVKHHFIDILNPDEYYSAGMFGIQARNTANSIFEKGKLPVVVGGSGLYIKAMIEGLFEEKSEEKDNSTRNALIAKYNFEGIDSLYTLLEKVDMESAKLYADKNPRRVIRALEYYYQTGKPISEAMKNDISNSISNSFYFSILMDKNELYNKINFRAEQMWNTGLIEETQNVINMGYSTELNSLNTVGYKECIQYLKNNIDYNEAVRLTKQNTRHYAKRQMTWLRKVNDVKWISGEPKSIANQIFNFLYSY